MRCILKLLAVIVASACHGFFLSGPLTQRRYLTSGPIQHDRRSISLLQESSLLTANNLQPGDFSQILKDHLSRNDTSLITVDCYVISRRKLGKQLAFVDFQTREDGDIVQALLRKEFFSDKDHHDGFRACLLKGTKVRVTGVASGTRIPGNTVLLIQAIELIAFPRQIQHIQIILQQALDKTVPFRQIENISRSIGATLLSNDDWKKTELKQLAKEIFRSLPEDPFYPSSADQQVLSKHRGNFVKPQAPDHWFNVPESVIQPVGILDELSPPLSTQNISDVIAMGSSQNATSQETSGASSPISAIGWVQNRRRFDNNISMIALVDELVALAQDPGEASIHKNRLCCLIHPDVVLSKADAEMYQNLLAVGAKVWVEGMLVYNQASSGRPELWVQEIRLLQSSSRSVTIRYLLDLLHDQVLDEEQVAEALLLPLEQVRQFVSMDKTERQWTANSLAADLQERSKIRRVRPEKLQVLNQYEELALKHPIHSDSTFSIRADTSVTNNNKRTPMPHGMPGSKWASKKRPQLEWMGNQIRNVLESHPEFGIRKLAILDIGGGKGALANYLGQTFSEQVEIHVVDISEGAVANGAKKAARLNLPVSFKAADATDSDVVDEIPVDMVVALHACGHLSDVALAHAVKRRAGFVIVPCCFNSNPHLKVSGTMSHLDESSAEMEVHEWLNIPKSDWSALRLLAEVQGDIPLASNAIATICAIRAEAAMKRLGYDPFQVEIHSFPIQYSTRNIVLVGSFHS